MLSTLPEDMRMPLEPSDAQLDALILGSASLSWLKVESLIVRVGELCEEQNLRFDPDVVAFTDRNVGSRR